MCLLSGWWPGSPASELSFDSQTAVLAHLVASTDRATMLPVLFDAFVKHCTLETLDDNTCVLSEADFDAFSSRMEVADFQHDLGPLIHLFVASAHHWQRVQRERSFLRVFFFSAAIHIYANLPFILVGNHVHLPRA